MRTKRHNVAKHGTPKSLGRRMLDFFRRHRILASLFTGAVVFAILGHHELSWLLLATRADKVIETLLGE